MKLRKIAAGILAAAMAVMSVPQAVSAVDFEIDLESKFAVGDIFYVKADENTGNVIGNPLTDDSDYAEDELYYSCKVLSDETIGIAAPMHNRYKNIFQYRITLPDTVMGYTVTQLGYPFGNNSYASFNNFFASINVPDTVQIIDNGAFWGNVALEEINFGANSQLTSIADNAFQNCRSLKSITIPAGVETIGSLGLGNYEPNMTALVRYYPSVYEPYADTYSLETVKFAEGSKITTIEIYAFMDQKNLKSIELPESVTYISPFAFEGSALETIYGIKGSYAETFANTYGYEFIAISTGDEPAPDNSNTFTDEETGVKVVDENGVLPKSAEMSVKYNDSGKDEGIVSYEISFKNENGEECDLTDTDEYEVWLPVPEEFRKNAVKVYIKYHGNHDLRAEYQDGFMVFKTSMLGVFYVKDTDFDLIDTPMPGPGSDTNITVTDNETGISVTGKVPEGAQLTVSADTENSTDTKLFYDISLIKDGEECQPEGTVIVKIPVPDTMQDNTSDLKVYHFIDGEYVDMNARLEDGYLVFETDHFSIYVVTSDVIPPKGDDNDDDTNTSDSSETPAPTPSFTGNFTVPDTTTAISETTEAPANTTTAPQTEATTAAPQRSANAPAASDNNSGNSNGDDSVNQPATADTVSESNAANVGNDGNGNDKSNENPSTGVMFAVVPVISAAAAAVMVYKKKK